LPETHRPDPEGLQSPDDQRRYRDGGKEAEGDSTQEKATRQKSRDDSRGFSPFNRPPRTSARTNGVAIRQTSNGSRNAVPTKSPDTLGDPETGMRSSERQTTHPIAPLRTRFTAPRRRPES
jgi:hypothetical protein